MNSTEELLWNYIDGNCTPEEQKAVHARIMHDEAFRMQYNGLLNLSTEFAAIELDEPPMAFTYNVMEAIRTENAQVPLKAAINKRIILGISVFFGLTILLLLIYIFKDISFSGGVAINVPATLKMPDASPLVSKPVMEGFLFFDLVLGLFLFDGYLRKKKQLN